MTVTIAASAVGATARPFAMTIDARWLMAYAAGVGETDARYFTTTAPGCPATHPLFLVCLEWDQLLALRTQVVPPELATSAVHATHHVRRHRVARAGDRLWTGACVTAVEPRRSGTLLTVKLDTADGKGAPVATTYHGSVFRGVGLADAVPATEERRGSTDALSPADVTWEDAIPVSATAAHVYTECSRIWNPIHTDGAVARAAGLPGPILHGTATLAMAVSRVVAREADGEPDLVRAVGARLTGMVLMPSTLRVRGLGRRGNVVAFDVLADDGRRVVADGAVELGRVPRVPWPVLW